MLRNRRTLSQSEVDRRTAENDKRRGNYETTTKHAEFGAAAH